MACHARTCRARSGAPRPGSMARAGARPGRMTRCCHEAALERTPLRRPLRQEQQPRLPAHPHNASRVRADEQASPQSAGARPLQPAQTRRSAHRASAPAPPQDPPRARRPRPGGAAPRQAAGRAVERVVAVRGRRGQVQPAVQQHQRAGRRGARRRRQRAHLVACARAARARSPPRGPRPAAPAARARPCLRSQRRRTGPPVLYVRHVLRERVGEC